MIKSYNDKGSNKSNSLTYKIMKTKKNIILSIAALMALGLMSFDILYSNGEPDYTGSPADGGLTCTTCHSDNAVNTGGGSVTISTLPAMTTEYSPLTEYTVSVTVAKTGQGAFGYGFEALKSNNTAAGTLTSINGGSQTMTGNGPINMVHNGSGIGTGTFTFTFKWTAPAVGTGAVTFYAAGNACNDDSGTGGDFVYTTSLALTEGTSTVGIANVSNAELMVYPNPAANNISIRNVANENLNVVMYDLAGREALNTKDISNMNNEISVLNIANGTYILRVYNETGLLKSDKIVVMH